MYIINIKVEYTCISLTLRWNTLEEILTLRWKYKEEISKGKKIKGKVVRRYVE